MEYRNRIQRTIDYIEDRLKDDISIRRLAGVACFSPFHFCRLFLSFTDHTIMDYVRQRRLAASVRDLKESRRALIDIAVDYSFGSRDSYTRAFKRVYGTSPGECRSQNRYPVPHERIVLRGPGKFTRSGSMIHGLKMKIMEMPGLSLAGYELKTNNRTNYGDIPKFWQKLDKDGSLEKTPRNLPISAEYGEVCLGFCSNFKAEDGTFSYIVGWIVEDGADLPGGFFSRRVPALTYAVFTTPDTNRKNFATVIQLTTRYVFHDWLSGSEYEFDERGVDFEWYDRRCHGDENICMDICVPVRKKV